MKILRPFWKIFKNHVSLESLVPTHKNNGWIFLERKALTWFEQLFIKQKGTLEALSKTFVWKFWPHESFNALTIGDDTT
jgi:hypothetical protein